MTRFARWRAERRKRLPRLFVIVDRSPFWWGWRFFAVRGMDEARRKCRKWVRRHPYGSASVVSPDAFRDYWRENCKSLAYGAPDLVSGLRECVVQ